MGEVIELKRDKPFTLRETQTLLPVVRRITEEAVQQVETLKKRLEETDPPPDHHPAYERELNNLVDHWSEKIIKLGAEPKGLWLVDFDNGSGYYCWRYPEKEVSFYHTYESGFNGRQPIL